MITLAIVKSMLGITDTTYDTQINTFLPIVKADVRRILNNSFHEKVYCTFESGSTTISDLYSYIKQYYEIDSDYNYIKRIKLNNKVEIGRVIEHTNIPDGAYITDIDELAGTVTISETTTGSGTYFRTSVDISQWQAISRMIWFRISKATTNTGVDHPISSKSMGIVSVSFDTSKINKTYGYPQSIIDDLGTALQGMF